MTSIKKKIKIYCSSFLPPKNNAWSHLKNISFGEYGDIESISKKNKDEDITILVLFFQDFIVSNETNLKQSDKKFEYIVKFINKRLRINQKPLILLYSFWSNENVIRTIKNQETIKKIKMRFQNKISKYLNTKNFFCADLDNEFGKVGFANSFDKRNWYFAHCRLSTLGIEVLANTVRKISKSIIEPKKKFWF